MKKEARKLVAEKKEKRGENPRSSKRLLGYRKGAVRGIKRL